MTNPLVRQQNQACVPYGMIKRLSYPDSNFQVQKIASLITKPSEKGCSEGGSKSLSLQLTYL